MSKKENYIVLYADEFDSDIWEEYCSIAKVSPDSTWIRINFDYKDVESDE